MLNNGTFEIKSMRLVGLNLITYIPHLNYHISNSVYKTCERKCIIQKQRNNTKVEKLLNDKTIPGGNMIHFSKNVPKRFRFSNYTKNHPKTWLYFQYREASNLPDEQQKEFVQAQN